jgi:RNA polymerase sigma factor (sigma-70 family)
MPRREDRHLAFPSTRWSRILAPGGARDLDELARAYWPPAQAYLAACLRCSPADAQDVAQDAFVWLLDRKLLDKADPARGRFRGFLKRALARFAIEHARRVRADKRGGAAAHAPIEAVDHLPDPTGKSPEDALDDEWRRQLLERAHARLRDELEASGRAVHYQLFRAYFLADDGDVGHAELAARHGITKTDVSNWLDHGKRRYRAILRELVAETVTSADELADELRWLFASQVPQA